MNEHRLAHLVECCDALTDTCHEASDNAGWWTDADTVPEKYIIPTKLCLVHSEISEAMEGFRKQRWDDHLPHRQSIEVELADALIRIFDIAGFLGLSLGEALVEKMQYNAQRADHKPDARAAEGGKKF